MWPVLVIIRADANVIDSADLLGWKAADPDTMLGGRQGDEIGQAPIIAPPPSEHGKQGVVKPPMIVSATEDSDSGIFGMH